MQEKNMVTKIINKEFIKWADKTEPQGYHAILSDPPYSLNFMNSAWDDDIAFKVKTWELVKKHLLDGAFGMAFASSRGWHRMAVAIEDAGFVIHPTIFCWVFGSGFPKATDISKMIDKQNGKSFDDCIKFTEYLISKKGKYSNSDIDKYLGLENGAFHFFAKSQSNNAIPRKKHYLKLKKLLSLDDKWDWYIEEAEREVIGKQRNTMSGWNTDGSTKFIDRDITNPATEKAKQWNGWKYGLQALKPAVEPIIVFQKPFKGKPIECIVKNGCGALNIDGGRIGYQSENDKEYSFRKGSTKRKGIQNWKKPSIKAERIQNSQGRFPSNFILTEQTAPLLDKQSGESKSNVRKGGKGGSGIYNGKFGNGSIGGQTDKGGASRFFYNVKTKIDEADPIKYQAKASKSERNAGLDDFEEKKKWLKGGGGTGISDRENIVSKNFHPTIKPLDLCRYLATLLLPPKEYNPKILIPFSGSGSEMIGALQAGWKNIDGVESDYEYCKIAEARLKYWSEKKADKERQLKLI